MIEERRKLSLRPIVALTILAAFTVGCANSPYRVQRMPDAELRAVPTGKLVRTCAYDPPNQASILRELSRRKDIALENGRLCPALYPEFVKRGWLSLRVVDAIKHGKLVVGMTKREMIISWGKPKESNTSTYSWGTQTQHVFYGQSGGRWGPYVYTKNGIVTSWQGDEPLGRYW